MGISIAGPSRVVANVEFPDYSNASVRAALATLAAGCYDVFVRPTPLPQAGVAPRYVGAIAPTLYLAVLRYPKAPAWTPSAAYPSASYGSALNAPPVLSYAGFPLYPPWAAAGSYPPWPAWLVGAIAQPTPVGTLAAAPSVGATSAQQPYTSIANIAAAAGIGDPLAMTDWPCVAFGGALVC